MQGNILKLYPQYSEVTDRRKEKQSAVIDRRVNSDRRSQTRVADKYLFGDILAAKDVFREFTEPIQAIHKLKEEQDRKNRTLEAEKIIFATFSPIIPVRRISSVPDNIINNDYSKAAGLVAVAAVLLPEDLRDMKDAWNQIVHKKLPKYDFINCQAPFSFFRGTFAEPLINKLGKWGYIIHEADKSLADTKLGEKIRKWLKVTITSVQLTGRKVPIVIKTQLGYKKGNLLIKAKKIEGSFINKLIYRAMQRTTTIGAGILFALWIPSIVKAFIKPKNVKDKFVNAGKQTAKATINNISVIAGIGLLGALGARKGPAFSVLGMGAGSVLGSLFAKLVNNNIKIKD